VDLEEIHFSLIIYFFSAVKHLSEDTGRQNTQVDIDPKEKFVEVSFLGPLCIIL